MINHEPTNQEVDLAIADFENEIMRYQRRQRCLRALQRFAVLAFSSYDIGSPSAIDLLNKTEQA